MPKFAKSDNLKTREIVKKFSSEFVQTPDNQLYCKICNTVVSHSKMFFMESHRKSIKHVTGMKNIVDNKTQMFLEHHKDNFKNDVVKAFVSADIPLWKMRNSHIRNLFQGIGKTLPSEQSCRLLLPDMYAEEKTKMKSLFDGKKIFMIIDETDVSGNRYVNVLLGLLDMPSKSYLVDCIPITAPPNSQIIIHIIDDTMKCMGIGRDNFSLLLSDAAPYMTSASKTLHVLYPNLFHVTCIAHLIHNCAMKVRAYYENVDILISRVRLATVKNRVRMNDFINIGPPPDTIVTRWGSWLKVALYYSKHFPEVKKIVEKWSGNGLLVKQAAMALKCNKLMSSLIEIQECYASICLLVQKFEDTHCSIAEAWDYLNKINFYKDPYEIEKYLNARIKQNEFNEIINNSRPDISP